MPFSFPVIELFSHSNAYPVNTDSDKRRTIFADVLDLLNGNIPELIMLTWPLLRIVLRGNVYGVSAPPCFWHGGKMLRNIPTPASKRGV